MPGPSDIEWTEATWNPVAGCTIASPGCTNCYAMRMAARLQAMGHAKYAGTTRKSGRRHVWTGRVALDEAALELPFAWRKPRRIFVNSMSDLFQDAVPEHFIRKLWGVMERAPWHTFQILTKRPDRMAMVLNGGGFPVLPNVWLGTSIEDAHRLPRLESLRMAPAQVRFISFEPLLGPIPDVDLAGIHWAIVGGESGPAARPMAAAWATAIRRNCRRQNTAFFFKQWGGRNKKAAGRTLAGRSWDEYPAAPATCAPAD
jgi:protein gp37